VSQSPRGDNGRMSSLPPWVAVGTLAFAVLGLGAVFGMAWRTARWKQHGPQTAVGAIHMACTVCQKELVFHRDILVLLTPPERALAVRVKPELVGRKLAEYVCPHCEAAHCFIVDGRRPEWVAANLYEPQTTSAHCMECHKPLRTPPWPPGEYDGRLEQAPALAPDYGLVCSRCQAVCCVACCANLARIRSKETKWMCPRCFRYPVDTLFYP